MLNMRTDTVAADLKEKLRRITSFRADTLIGKWNPDSWGRCHIGSALGCHNGRVRCQECKEQ